MKRPGIFTYVLGNWVVALGVFAIGGLLVFQWWQGRVDNDIAPAIAVLLMISAANANQKLTEYANWRRAWNAMSGAAPRKRRGPSRQTLGMLLWLVIALVFTGMDRSKPETMVAIVCFSLATALLLAGLALQYRRRRRFARIRAGQAHVVAVKLRVPSRSPDAQRCAEHLPEYCMKLLEKPSKEPVSWLTAATSSD